MRVWNFAALLNQSSVARLDCIVSFAATTSPSHQRKMCRQPLYLSSHRVRCMPRSPEWLRGLWLASQKRGGGGHPLKSQQFAHAHLCSSLPFSTPVCVFSMKTNIKGSADLWSRYGQTVNFKVDHGIRFFPSTVKCPFEPIKQGTFTPP